MALEVINIYIYIFRSLKNIQFFTKEIDLVNIQLCVLQMS